MKQKLFFSIILIAFSLCFFQNTILAQGNPAIPSKNAFMLELNFKPFGDDIISFNQLQLKYKLNDNLALRLGLAFDYNTWDLSGDDYDPSEIYSVSGEDKSTEFGILPGIEYHFLKNSKVSPYLGLEFSFFNRSVESHYKDIYREYDYDKGGYYYVPVEIDIDGATRNVFSEYHEYNNGYHYCTYTEYSERAYSSFGGNLLIGSDFYFMRNMYVGVEVGLGYNHFNYKKVKIDVSNEVNPTILPSYTTTEFKFYYNSALRLGFWF